VKRGGGATAFSPAHEERGSVGEMIVEETLREWGK
jgi:hypothetical protein